MVHRRETNLEALDRLHLAATSVEPDAPAGRAVVLVHGVG
jgi:hypothetical protein